MLNGRHAKQRRARHFSDAVEPFDRRADAGGETIRSHDTRQGAWHADCRERPVVTTAPRRLRHALLIALVPISAAHASPTLARDLIRRPRLPGRLIVRERAGLSDDALRDTLHRNGARCVGVIGAMDAAVIEVSDAELPWIEAALRRSGAFKSVERDYVARIAEAPNDRYYAAQWGLPRVAAPAAWEVASGAGVVVAVLDTGIEASHPDLQGERLAGYDFVNDDDDPSDDHGHGTRMSGIIAAQRDNGEGVVGVAPAAVLMPVKVLDQDGLGAYSAVANGITYAVDHGARVLNLSLVGPVASDVLQAAIDYATAHDVVVVAAAGNDGSSVPTYPAAAAGVVAVSAIDARDVRPSFSNYGAWIGFAAPGVDIVTTSLDGGYASSVGTSPAAAFGSGIFALLFSADPTLRRSDAIERVQRGAVDLGRTGWDQYYGWGRADAYAALVPGQHRAVPPDSAAPEVAIVSPVKDSLTYGMVPVDVAASDDVGVTRVELFIDNHWFATATAAPYQFVVDATRFAPGRHRLRAYAYDSSGHVGQTKSQRVWFTPGTGLLVERATVKATSVTISAAFALPSGSAFDPGRDSLAISLSSASGMVLDVSAEAGELSSSHSGTMKATLAPVVPASGSVRMGAKRRGDASIYTVKLKAAHLSGMPSLQSLMTLTVQVGSMRLSQSLPLRARATALIYP
jgi:subtilisin family serine protease